MINVLIVDDSAVVRQVFTRELSLAGDIVVVGAAPDPYVAREMIAKLRPDVITLDVEMPRMDGITFLRKIMRYHPLPVVVVSSLTTRGGEVAMQALASGAVEVLCKGKSAFSIDNTVGGLVRAVRMAATADVHKLVTPAKASVRQSSPLLLNATNQVVAIGASTGGTTAIEHVLAGLPPDFPGVVIAQHMPAAFTESFAARLKRETSLDVREGHTGDSVVPGAVLIAPGNHHMLLRRSGARYYVETTEAPRVNSHRPSVDVLFDSVAASAGRNATGVLLTGMGGDGAKGLLAMRQAGASTIAQDEASCVVFGMPRVAIELGAAEQIVTLGRISDHMVRLSRGRGVAKKAS